MKHQPKTYAEAWFENEKSIRRHNLLLSIIGIVFLILMILSFIIAFNI